MNTLSLGLLSKQLDKHEEETNGELYRDLPEGTKLTLSNGNVILTPPNSRLVETRTDIILQSENGDLFIIPDGTSISIPKPKESANEEAKNTLVKAEASLNPVEVVDVEGGAVLEGFNNDLEEENKLDELTDDYSRDLLHIGLEKSVREQHKEYANKQNRVTSTANYTSVRDDNQDINPRVGLRKINYQGVNFDNDAARAIPSQVDFNSFNNPETLYLK
mgnify:CR=1 FL=1